MRDKPERTGVTDLLDAELLLFDLLFQWPSRRKQLSNEDYPIHMNCRYSHGLDDAALDRTLQNLVARKLIWSRTSGGASPESIFTLTPDGGHKWELERKPNWERYIDAQTNFTSTRQTALGLNETIVRLYLGAIFACGLIHPVGRMQIRKMYRCRILPWKTFDVVTVVRVPISHRDWRSPVDWDVYKANRTWWRDVHELDALNRKAR